MLFSIDARYMRSLPSGIGTYVRAIVERMPQMAPRDDFHLWVGPTTKRPVSAAPNTRESLVHAGPNTAATMWWPSRLVDLRHADVLHAPFSLLGRKIPCPTVVTMHDLMWLTMPRAVEPPCWRTPFRARFYGAGMLRALREATRLIAVSEATADAIVKVMPSAQHRVRVILHGVDASFSPATDEESARRAASGLLNSDAPYFLVVGKNTPYKNHIGILDAFAAAELPTEVRLVLLQRTHPGGPLARRARELGIEDRVSFVSGLDVPQIVTLLRGTLALVQYSLCEGFGMPVAEAMACGTPVVASDIASLVEVGGGAALHVSLDPRALAAALKRMWRETALRIDLAGRGLERARAFSWSRSVAQHLEVLREAASGAAALTRTGT